MRIALERASVRFGKLAVTDEVTLAVESGDFVTIVGPSGCGKSTLLNAIAGLLDAVDCRITGRVHVEGDHPGRPRLAYVFQRDTLLQAELLRIWERRRMTTVFVTHDLAEAIVLGQRVVVMSRRPGRVKRVYDIPLPSPRDPFELRASPQFAKLETSIWADLRDEF